MVGCCGSGAGITPRMSDSQSDGMLHCIAMPQHAAACTKAISVIVCRRPDLNTRAGKYQVATCKGL
jgi:hypothetical protein